MNKILIALTLISTQSFAKDQTQTEALRVVCSQIQGQTEYFDTRCAKLAEKDAKRLEKLKHMSSKDQARMLKLEAQIAARIKATDIKIEKIKAKLAKNANCTTDMNCAVTNPEIQE